MAELKTAADKKAAEKKAAHWDKKLIPTARKVSAVIRNHDTVVTYTVRDEGGRTVTRMDLASQMPDEWLERLKV